MRRTSHDADCCLPTATSFDLGPAGLCPVASAATDRRSPRSSPAPSASGRSRSPTTSARVTRDLDRGRARKSIWRYRQLLPVPTDVAPHPNTEPGLTRLIQRRPARPRRWASAALWVKDDTGNPTHSFKDRVVAVALAAARELGFTVLACPSTGNLANAVAAAAARAGWDSVVLIPATLEQAKILHDRRVRRHAARRRGQLRRRQPAGHASWRPSTRTGRSSTSTSGPTTPRAPRPWATRSPSSSAGGCPGRSWSRWRRARS